LSRRETLDALRKKIDQVDEKIVEFLNERACLAQRIGQSKNLKRKKVYVPSREKAVIQRVCGLSRGPLSDQAIRSIYREILSASRSLEASIRVAYLGPEATFTHAAARDRFGSSATFLPLASITDVFREVSCGRASYGVVPIENSTEGVVNHTLDMLVEEDVGICAEVFLEIHLCLLSRSGRLDQVKRIVSHPQALAQCRHWLEGRFSHVRVDEVASTAQAAKMAVHNPNVAAIAGGLAKEFYGLEMLERNIEDHANNITRFLVIGDAGSEPSGGDKTSIVFSVKDEVGVLHHMLDPFAKNGVNLTRK
jgi:chorismate mutase/prephenate dehydratase